MQGFQSFGHLSLQDLPCILQSFIKINDLSLPIFKSDDNPLYRTNYFALTFEPAIMMDFDIHKDTVEAKSKFQEKLGKNWKGWVSIFTDASKLSNVGHVGATIWVPKHRIILSY